MAGPGIGKNTCNQWRSSTISSSRLIAVQAPRTVVAEPEEDEREVGAQQPHLHCREYGLGNGMYFFVIAAAAVTCSKPLPQTAETLQLRHLQRKQAVCRNAGLKTKRRFPHNSSVESVTQ
ncbi:hypothetical protein ACLOJK_036034 [Asimina triloba]